MSLFSLCKDKVDIDIDIEECLICRICNNK